MDDSLTLSTSLSIFFISWCWPLYGWNMSQTLKRPRITKLGLRLSFETTWRRMLDDPINCLTVGKPFLEELNEENDILIGTSSGRILILNVEKVNEWNWLQLLVPSNTDSFNPMWACRKIQSWIQKAARYNRLCYTTWLDLTRWIWSLATLMALLHSFLGGRCWANDWSGQQ